MHDLDDGGPYSGFLMKPLQKILNDRGVDGNQVGNAFHQIILDQLNNGNGKCKFLRPGYGHRVLISTRSLLWCRWLLRASA